MKNSFSRSALATSALVLGASFPLSSAAIEQTSNGGISSGVYNDLLNSSDMRVEFLRQRLAQERQDRIDGDKDVTETVKSRLDKIDQRIQQLDARVTKLSEDVDLAESDFLKQVEKLRQDAVALRKEMQRQMKVLNDKTVVLEAYMRGEIASLDKEIRQIYKDITTLNQLTSQLRDDLTALENFAKAASDRQAYLRACFANGSCVAYSPPKVETRTFDLYAGNSGFSQDTAYRDTGISTQEWQFCGLGGATNQSRRDFRIYASGGTWWLSNEMDNHALGDESGTLTARCIKVY